MSKTLAAYFSASGITAQTAKELAPDTAIVKGKLLNGRQTAAGLQAWGKTVL